MGHTACGAIKGAIDGVQFGNLTALLAKIHPAIEATRYTGERSAKNYAFVDAVAQKNVLLTNRINAGRTAFAIRGRRQLIALREAWSVAPA
jgi:carbonic anhydrase